MENIFLKKNKGFTLLEILIVIAIIGILVSLGVVSYASAQAKSRDSRRRSDMKAVQSGWEQYYADNNGNYPLDCNANMSSYLPAGFPSDPKGTGDSVYLFTDHCAADSYCFCAKLEAGTGNSAVRASGTSCTFGSGSYYCVGSLQ
jgi:prepilin-type N-terminal cleavage/methylation domain-containing protein